MVRRRENAPTVAPLESLIKDPNNANRGTDRGRKAVRESLEESGAGRSILIDKNGMIIAGNKTAEAAAGLIADVIIVKTDGSQIVAVQRTDLDLAVDPEAKLLAVRDNRAGELNLDWDPLVLKGLTDLDLSSLWTEDELAQVLALAVAPPPGNGRGGKEENDDDLKKLLDEAEAGRLKLRVKAGDVWQLGPHRLMCGDSTKQTDIDRLFAGKLAQAVITDPPYNVDYDPENRVSQFSAKRLSAAGRLGKIDNDKMTDAQFCVFLDAAFGQVDEHLEPGGPIYLFHADMIGHHFRAAFAAKWKIQSTLIWLKTRLTFGREDYHWIHEPILYGWKEGAAHRWYGDRKQTTILEFPAAHYDKTHCDTNGYVHSCQKPTPLLRYLLGNSSVAGDIVFDPFGGSGSTLIAADQEDRIGYVCELDPRFASVILERWENFSGEKGQKVKV